MGIYILIRTINILYNIIMLLLFARAIMSWVVRDYSHPVASFLYNVTEPILTPMRMLFDKLNLNRGMIDFSFLATFFAIQIIYKILLRFLLPIYYGL